MKPVDGRPNPCHHRCRPGLRSVQETSSTILIPRLPSASITSSGVRYPFSILFDVLTRIAEERRRHIEFSGFCSLLAFALGTANKSDFHVLRVHGPEVKEQSCLLGLSRGAPGQARRPTPVSAGICRAKRGSGFFRWLLSHTRNGEVGTPCRNCDGQPDITPSHKLSSSSKPPNWQRKQAK